MVVVFQIEQIDALNLAKQELDKSLSQYEVRTLCVFIQICILDTTCIVFTVG